MVTVLLSLFDIKTCCLQMSVFQCADPYIFPGRRNDQLIDPCNLFLVSYFFTVFIIGIFLSRFFTGNSGGLCIGGIYKMYRLCRSFRVLQGTDLLNLQE